MEATPILHLAAAAQFEATWFGGDETREWAAMRAAGVGVAHGIERDFAEIGPWPASPRVLALAGRGHNGGDALLAAAELSRRHPAARIDVVLATEPDRLRPLVRRALAELGPQARRLEPNDAWATHYDVVIEGVFGFRYRSPLEGEAARLLTRVNAHPVRLRAAVDLPAGLDDPGAFVADFTYATGIIKHPLPDLANAGRVRWIDLGFELAGLDAPHGRLLTAAALAPLAGLRPTRCDKRDFGRLVIVAGSRRYPGAALMATLAALRAGTGLVTAAVPESLVSAFAARAPEAMWLGLPETPDGGLALEGIAAARQALSSATAALIGPGLGTEPETLALATELTRRAELPLVLDADALRPTVVAAGAARRVLTPHAGEFARLGDAAPPGAVLVRKGPVTRIDRVGASTGETDLSTFGGPVLARGGSGDLLAGMIGALLAARPADELAAARRAVVWHGLAAESLARARGQTAVRTTELLDHLAPALRECATESARINAPEA